MKLRLVFVCGNLTVVLYICILYLNACAYFYGISTMIYIAALWTFEIHRVLVCLNFTLVANLTPSRHLHTVIWKEMHKVLNYVKQ